MKITILIGFIISTLNLYSKIQIQEYRNCDSSVITTLAQNNKWIENIVNVDFEKQLNILSERILLDTNICIPAYYCDRFKIKIFLRDSSKIKSDGKPLMIFDNYPLYISEFDNYKNVDFISSLINSNNIENLNIWSGDTATAVWGTRANFGVLLLQTKYNSSFEALKGLNFNFKTQRAEFTNNLKFNISSNSDNKFKLFIDNPFENLTVEIFNGQINGYRSFNIKSRKFKGAFVILRIENENITYKILFRRKH